MSGLKLRCQFRRYQLPFRTSVRTAHGLWTAREGVIVRLETVGDAAGAVGFGEAAPVPGFGMEPVDEIVAACAAVGEWIELSRLEMVPAELPTLRQAFAAARHELAVAAGTAPASLAPAHATLGLAALLPAGKPAVALIEAKAEAGFRVFKWKVGVGDVADELVVLDDLCARLPSGGKLRLDANGAWDRRQAERWLERCAERPVEFVEQPVLGPRPPRAASASWGKAEDLLLGLAHDFPVKLALDESLVADGDVERWIGAGWPGIFVVKPALAGDLAGLLDRLHAAAADVVFSSALETAVAARRGLQAAFDFAERERTRAGGKSAGAGVEAASSPREPVESAATRPAARLPRALGYGVWPLFADARCDGPAAAPYLRQQDLAALGAARVWAAIAP